MRLFPSFAERRAEECAWKEWDHAYCMFRNRRNKASTFVCDEVSCEIRTLKTI